MAIQGSHLIKGTIPIIDAAPAIGRHPETLRRWCRNYPRRVGVKIAGRWQVYEHALQQVADGVPLENLQ
jgi:transposase-like protein